MSVALLEDIEHPFRDAHEAAALHDGFAVEHLQHVGLQGIVRTHPGQCLIDQLLGIAAIDRHFAQQARLRHEQHRDALWLLHHFAAGHAAAGITQAGEVQLLWRLVSGDFQHKHSITIGHGSHLAVRKKYVDVGQPLAALCILHDASQRQRAVWQYQAVVYHPIPSSSDCNCASHSEPEHEQNSYPLHLFHNPIRFLKVTHPVHATKIGISPQNAKPKSG